ALRAQAEARGQRLGVLVRRDDRRPYHEVYRARFPGAEAPARPDRAVPGPVPTFAHQLERSMSVVLAGSAGERVQSAAAILCQAAVLSGLHCVQKNDYPVTVGSGFSLSEVKLSTEPILYTGVDTPDAVLIVSGNGLNEIRGRGDLARLAPGGLVLADASLPPDSLPEQVLALPLRATLSADLAALGAVAVLVHRTGILAPAALLAGIEALGLKDAEGLRRVVASAAALEAERPSVSR
ncbi:MAG: 2-oxoacid:acceptor oxidoreductase family protein, partial [Chloroflexi bacterium]|nr:2-oxoacid:acceptor oxidoreductase family protein [Chloroflexota bacterium]